MSYILEALKKVERKRVLEESPGSLTLLGAPESEPKKRPFWPYPVVAALLLNIGVMIWGIGPWRTEKKAPSSQPYAVQPAKLAPPILARKNKPGLTGDKKEAPRTKSVPGTTAEVPKAVQSTKLPSPILAGQTKPSPASDKKEGAQEKSVPKTLAEVSKKEIRDVPLAEISKKEVRNVPSAGAGKPQTTVQPPAEPKPGLKIKKESAPSGKVYDLDELPQGIKSTLPEFRVSAHVYNPDRQSRMVRVNDRILHEGEELSPGLKVEEIVPGAIIFNYQGYRFRFGL